MEGCEPVLWHCPVLLLGSLFWMSKSCFLLNCKYFSGLLLEVASIQVNVNRELTGVLNERCL